MITATALIPNVMCKLIKQKGNNLKFLYDTKAICSRSK